MLAFLTLLIIGCSGISNFKEKPEEALIVEPDSYVAEKIPIDINLRLNNQFDYSTYWGIFRSQKELDKIWSELVNIRSSYPYNPGVKVPPPPQVDFSSNIVLWVADRGIGASFVKSIALNPDKESKTLNVLVTAGRSDFRSSHLNLWKIPRTDYKVVMKVKYETDKFRLR